MINLQINKDYQKHIRGEKLEKAAKYTLKHHKVDSSTDLSIVITGDEQLQNLNREYLGIDKPTDVLSFPSGDPDPDSGLVNLGDILISYPAAKAQAEEAQHDIMDELTLLVVHGLLHLLDYDHDTPENRSQMWGIQEEILRELDVEVKPHE